MQQASHRAHGLPREVEEMQFNIPRELDFRMEADNADVCRGLCRPFGDRVVVPAVHRSVVPSPSPSPALFKSILLVTASSPRPNYTPLHLCGFILVFNVLTPILVSRKWQEVGKPKSANHWRRLGVPPA